MIISELKICYKYTAEGQGIIFFIIDILYQDAKKFKNIVDEKKIFNFAH